MLLKTLILLIAVGNLSSARATEVDSFTQRNFYLLDSTFLLDKKVNNWLENSIKNTQGCDPTSLFQSIQKTFNRFGWSKFESAVVKDTAIKKHFPLKNHVYHKFKKTNSPSTIDFPHFISPLLKVNGVLIGADKFSHFFNEGLNYFKKTDLELAKAYGEWMERTFWGEFSTGVYSYSDLSANYHGFNFFKNLINSTNPYFICEKDKWKKNRNFTWKAYVDSSWDEGINCNSFRNSSLEHAFVSRVMEIELEQDKNLQCPTSSKECEKLLVKYGNLSNHLISPTCR